MQIGGRQSGLPVVRVHDVGHEVRDATAPNFGRGGAERRETQRVVGPFTPVCADVGIARTRVEVRRIEDEEIEVRDIRSKKPRGRAVHGGKRMHGLGVAHGLEHDRIARHQRPHRHTFPRKRLRQRADDVGQAAGLDQWKDFGRDRQNA